MSSPLVFVGSPVNPAIYGSSPFLITATLQVDMTGQPFTGSVKFTDGGSFLGESPLTNFPPPQGFTGWAAVAFKPLVVGDHQIVAAYSGNNYWGPATGTLTYQTVIKADTSTSISMSPPDPVACQSLLFTAKVVGSTSLGNLPSGTVAFGLDGLSPYNAPLNNGVATYMLDSLDPAGNPYSISATYPGDMNYNGSNSDALNFVIDDEVGFVLTATAFAPDPWQSTPICPGGTDAATGANQSRSPTIDPKRSSKCPCGCGCANDSSSAGACPINPAYNSATVNVKPIILAKLQTDFCTAAPTQITAQLTWNGTAQATVTYSVSGSPGAVYLIPLQVSTPVTTTGFYPWSVDVQATVGTMVYDRTASDKLSVQVNTNSNCGAGRAFAGVASLLPGGSVAMGMGGFSGMRYFTGSPTSLPFTYTSPPNDQGTLVQNSDGTYTYTAKDQTKHQFDSSGRQTSKTDPQGLTQSLGYSGGLLHTITDPDGGVATLSYNGSNLLSQVAMPGGRFITYSYDGSNNLTGIVDATGDITTMSYDGSNRLINEQIGPTNTTYTYATNGSLLQIDRGLGSITTIVAASTQGLGGGTAPTAGQAVTTVTDPLGRVTSYTLDTLGRLTQLQTPDSALQTWVLDAAGKPLVYIDQRGNVTTNTYDRMENLIQVQHPDGSLATYQYDPTFNMLTQSQDELGNISTNTYDPMTSDLLTRIDALGFVTTFTWSNGLKQTMTDALGRVTTYAWDSSTRRLLSEQDPLGHFTTFGYDVAGNATTEKDPLGRVTTSTYDGNRMVLTKTDPLGGVQTMTYDGAENLITAVDQLGRKTTYVYDQRSLRVAVIEPISLLPVSLPGIALPRRLATSLGSVGPALARTTTMAYDAATNLLSTTDPLGHVTSYGYDTLNRRIAQIDGLGSAVQRSTTMGYDLAGNLLFQIDPRGTTASYVYDSRNRRTQRIDAYGTGLQRTRLTVFDAASNVFNRIDPAGTTTSFGYDADNRQIVQIEGVGSYAQRSTTTAYDPVGNVLSVTNAIGAITTFSYDALNRRTVVTEAQGDPNQRSTTLGYDAVGNVLSVTNPRNYVTSFGYDALDRRINQVDAVGTGVQRTATMVYDPVGNRLSQSNGLGVITSFAYDALNRRINQFDAFGTSLQRAITMGYDRSNNLSAYVDPLGFETAFDYDALNRLVKTLAADGGVTTVSYDPNSNVVNRADPLGHTTTYSFDVLNRQTSSQDARGGVVILTYDVNDNLLSLTDPVTNTTTWQYDVLNRKINETDPLANTSAYLFDPVDRLASVVDQNSQTINSGYDLLNRLTGESWLAVGGSQVNLLTFSYDANNNLLTAANNAGTITRTYDALDRLATNQDVFGTALTFSYDAANNRTAVQDSFGATTTRVYDALNRATTMLFGGPGQTPLREDFAYSVRDQVTQQTRYSNLGGTTTVGYSQFGYDSMRRPTNLQHLNGSGANIANYTNTYDLASRITAEVLNGGAPTSYSYDVTDQLTNDSVVTYSYDLNGNRTMSGYATGAGNELLSDGVNSYTYDNNGNQVTKTKIATGEIVTYSYDNRNRLVGVQDTTSPGLLATYVYDAVGQRVESDVQISGVTTVTRFASDDSRQIWADMNGSNGLVQRYVRGTQVLELLARVSGGGTAAWLLVDRMGSIRNVVNSTGTVIDTIIYDGFGNVSSETNSPNGGSYKYDGYRFDVETVLYRSDLSFARYYYSAIGRWSTSDPIGIGPDTSLYRYVKNNPSNYLDPSGLYIFKFKKCLSGSYLYVYFDRLLTGGERDRFANEYARKNNPFGGPTKSGMNPAAIQPVELSSAELILTDAALGAPDKERAVAQFLTIVSQTDVTPNIPILDRFDDPENPKYGSVCVRWSNKLQANCTNEKDINKHIVLQQVTLDYGNQEHSIILAKVKGSNAIIGIDQGAIGGSQHIFDPEKALTGDSIPATAQKQLRQAIVEFGK